MSITVVFILFAAGLGFVLLLGVESPLIPTSYQARAQRALRKRGIDAEFWLRAGQPTPGGRYRSAAMEFEYEFEGVDGAGLHQTGIVIVSGFGATVRIDGAGAQRARQKLGLPPAAPAAYDAPEPLPREEEPVLDTAEQINREVVRRLDVLQSERSKFLASDVNGDGLVDADEWELTRARVRREVEAEFVAELPTTELGPASAIEHDIVPFKMEFDVGDNGDPTGGSEEPNDEVW